mmetsp:Transcript_28037/g.47546  ORF Transcript_28037/g.47546 Transcript_28037/m.47546 type:complete len:212 (-) Transcript_28037:1126-1761(-)
MGDHQIRHLGDRLPAVGLEHALSQAVVVGLVAEQRDFAVLRNGGVELVHDIPQVPPPADHQNALDGGSPQKARVGGHHKAELPTQSKERVRRWLVTIIILRKYDQLIRILNLVLILRAEERCAILFDDPNGDGMRKLEQHIPKTAAHQLRPLLHVELGSSKPQQALQYLSQPGLPTRLHNEAPNEIMGHDALHNIATHELRQGHIVNVLEL